MRAIFASLVIALTITGLLAADCRTYECKKVSTPKGQTDKNCGAADGAVTSVQANCKKDQTCQDSGTTPFPATAVPNVNAMTCVGGGASDKCPDEFKNKVFPPGDLCNAEGCEGKCYGDKGCPGSGYCATDDGLAADATCDPAAPLCVIGTYCDGALKTC